MSDQPYEPGPKDAMPEGTAKLYSIAHPPGVRYKGFSASRQQVQERLRERIARDQTGSAAGLPGDVRGVTPLATEEMMDEISVSRLKPRKNGATDWVQPVSSDEPLIEPNVPRASGHEDGSSDFDLRPEASPVEGAIALPPGFAQRPPSIVVFSLASGVGKTCLTATLGRALSALGEQVLLVDTAPQGWLPLYFGSTESKPGVARSYAHSPFFSASFVKSDSPVAVQLLNLEAERFPLLESGQDWLLGKLIQQSRGLSRILIDVATAGRELRRLLLLRPVILVPITPGEDAVTTVDSLESLLRQYGHGVEAPQTFFVLNRFEMGSTEHQTCREVLQARLGDRLLPFLLNSSPAFGEALVNGMTVMDYAPESTSADNYRRLAEWLRGIVTPAVAAPDERSGPKKK